MAGINTGVWSPWLQPWGGNGQWGSPAPFDMTVGQPNVLGGGMFGGGGGPAGWGNLLPAFGGGFGGGWNGSPNGQMSALGVGMNWDGVNNPQLSANAAWSQWQNGTSGSNVLNGGIGIVIALFLGLMLGRRNSGSDSDDSAMASNSSSREGYSGSTPVVGNAHSSESERTYYGPRYTKATGRGVPTGQTEREAWVHPQNSHTRTV